MTMRRIAIAAIFTGSMAPAQAPTMKQIMLDLIHPASNDILLTVNRGGPASAAEWTSVRHNALALAESGNLLVSQGPSQAGPWVEAAKRLADAGAEAYRAAQAKDKNALNAVTGRIDASCTSCHKQFRPNVFPPQEGGSK